MPEKLHSLTPQDIDTIHDPAEQTVADYLYYLFHRLGYGIYHEPPMIRSKQGKMRSDFLVQSPLQHISIETAKGDVHKTRKEHQLAIARQAGEPYIQIDHADANPRLGFILGVTSLFLSGRISFPIALAEIFKGDHSIYSVRIDR